MNKKTKTNSWSSRQPVSRQFPVGCGLYIFPSHGNIRLYPVHHVCDVWRGLGGDLSSEGGLGGEFLRRHLIFNTSCSKWQRGGFVFFTQIQFSLNRKIDAKVDKGPLWFATGFQYKSPTVENLSFFRFIPSEKTPLLDVGEVGGKCKHYLIFQIYL